MSQHDDDFEGEAPTSDLVPSEILSKLTEEAKELWAPEGAGSTGDSLDQQLFARIDAYERDKKHSRRLWAPLGLATAIAAGALAFVHSHGDAPSAEVDRSLAPIAQAPLPPPDPPRPTAPAELTAMTGGGVLEADGVPARVHEAPFHDGVRLESRGGDAVFAAPGRVDWLLERGTEVSTVRAGSHGGAIVLALAVGAVEAQVVPVIAGEAFAVDVDTVRVAVHGTHLRVGRQERGGNHIVVDLSEGVISVGAPPKAGPTVGTLVTAPAHVEFDITDPKGTLLVDHEPSHVRAAVDPVGLGQSSANEVPVAEAPNPAVGSVGSAPAPLPRPPISAAQKKETAEEIVTAAIRRCASETVHKREGTVTISSVLSFEVDSSGAAHTAIFHPPLVPDMQACVSKTVFETVWTQPGPHTFPIELRF
jgi:hypothetical protein